MTLTKEPVNDLSNMNENHTGRTHRGLTAPYSAQEGLVAKCSGDGEDPEKLKILLGAVDALSLDTGVRGDGQGTRSSAVAGQP